MITVSGEPKTVSEIESNILEWISAIKDARKSANSKIWLVLDIRDLKVPSLRTVPRDLHLREIFKINVAGLYGVVSSTSQRLKMRIMFLFLRKGNAIMEYVTDAQEVISREQERIGVFPPLD